VWHWRLWATSSYRANAIGEQNSCSIIAVHSPASQGSVEPGLAGETMHSQLEIMVSKIVCDFGCDRAAIKQLNNGRFVCAEFVAQCTAMRAKNSAANCGRNPFANRPHPRGMAGKIPWNRGMTWAQMFGESRAEEMRQIGRANVARANEMLRASPDLEARRREKLSEIARQRRLGQYREGSGRGRKGRYKGHWCDSSYELAFVIYAVDHGFWFKRNWEAFAYPFEGRTRTWIPDFRLKNNMYLEIKGYESRQTQAKFAAFPHGLIVVKRENMQFVFDYVVGRYGRDFTRLYE
jgi:hypothetical protein